MRTFLHTATGAIVGAIIGIWLYATWLSKDSERDGEETHRVEHRVQTVARPSTDRWTPVTFRSYQPSDFTKASLGALKAVVYINAETKRKFSPWMPAKRDETEGSGVIIDPEGYIATNHHVIEDADVITVELYDKRSFTATLVGSDPSTDLALLKIQAQDTLPYLEFGNSDSLQIGEWVLALGNPKGKEGLPFTVTAGIVSAKGRDINILADKPFRVESFIQTDAAINPGSSGGPLINTAGQIVGINSAILSRDGAFEGYSFAIPSNLTLKVLNDIRQYGSVQRAILGVQIYELPPTSPHLEGYDYRYGLLIERVLPRSGAYDAGLRRGDILVQIDSFEINSLARMQEIIAQKHPGDLVDVVYLRNGQIDTATVTLKNTDNRTELIRIRRDKVLMKLGFVVRDLYTDEKKKYKTDGARVTTIYEGSPIRMHTDLTDGFIITSINQQRVHNANDVVNALKDAKGKIVLVGFYEHNPSEEVQYVFFVY